MVEPTLLQRILCVDDSPALRDGLRALITLEPDLEWVGGASDGEEGVRFTERLQPDVVILDIDMPGLSGLELRAASGHVGRGFASSFSLASPPGARGRSRRGQTPLPSRAPPPPI